MAERIRPDEPTDRPALIATFGLAVGVPCLLFVLSPARSTPFLLGGAAWLVAVVVKMATSVLLGRAVRGGPPRLLWAAVYGVLSAATELGAAAYCFVRVLGPLGWADVVGFGVGAFSAETVLFIAPAAVYRAWKPDRAQAARWQAGARRSRWVRYAALIERTAALFNHVGSRALVYAAFRPGPWVVALVAGLAFASVDGVAAYGRLSRWDWFTPAILRRYYAFALGIGVVSVAASVMRLAR